MSKDSNLRIKKASQTKQEEPPTTKVKIKRLVKNNKSKVLSVAVAIAVGTALTSCTHNEDSYYRQGAYTDTSSQIDNGNTVYGGSGYHYIGSYYYGRGANYTNGSWGKASDGTYIGGDTGFSTHGGGTDGIGA